VDCTDILYVPKVTVSILTLNVPKLAVLKKHEPKVYVPKLSHVPKATYTSGTTMALSDVRPGSISFFLQHLAWTNSALLQFWQRWAGVSTWCAP